MNIALFTDCYLPSVNGVVTVVEQLREGLVKEGHHVVIVTVKSDQVTEESPDIYRAVAMPAHMGMKDQFFGLPWIPKVVRYLKKNKIDLIHCHTEFTIGYAGYEAARKLHIPCIFTAHTMWEDYYQYYLPFGKIFPLSIIRMALHSVYSRYSNLIAVSSKTKKYLQNDYLCPDKPIAVVPNALDIKKFSSKSATPEEIAAHRQSLGFDEEDIVTMFVGRVSEEKRIIELMETGAAAIQKNSHIKLLIVGDGPSLETCKKIARYYNIEENVVFTGFVSWDNLYLYYKSADIFINASLSETYSMTVLEALMSGLPMVVRDDDCIRDRIIHGKNGYLAQTDEEMTGYILELASDAGKRKQFSESNLELIRKYMPDVFTRKHIAIYECLLKNYPKKVSEEELEKAVSSAEGE